MAISMLLLLLATEPATDAEITWMQLDWPPHQIVSGAFSGQGTYDLLANQLMAKLPQFKHRVRLTNLQRLEQAFVQGEQGICTMVGTLYSDARAKNRLFSSAIIVGSRMVVGYLTNQIAQHPALASGYVDLTQLASDPAFTGAYQPDRQYPAPVKAAITMQNNNLIAHNFTSEVNAVALLKSARVHYVLEYPERLHYFNQLLDAPVQLRYSEIVGIKDNADSYIACSRDRIGQSAIEAIDQILPQLWHDEAYLKAMRRWLDDDVWQNMATDVQRVQQALGAEQTK